MGRWILRAIGIFSLALGLCAATAARVSTAQTTFVVTVENKTEEHPFSGQGASEGYVIDGTQGKTVTLVRGETYIFQMSGVPTFHPFYLSTNIAGAGAAPYEEGVEGSGASGNATLVFTPGEDTPSTLYYNCLVHTYMGGLIQVVSPPEVELALVAEGFAHPLALAEPPDDSGRLFVVDQTGQIYVVTPDGMVLEEPFLDIRDRMVALNPGYDERGLLGLAFHPSYAENGRFFVYYSAPLREEAPDDFNNTSHISEFVVSSSDPNRADPESERVLLQVDQPQVNHAAGTLAFGPEDGYLYIALGDGGGGGDTGTGHVEDWYDANAGGNGQDVTQNLLGSILRIDVDTEEAGLPYGIPDDNPFVGGDGLDEQYAYGFRNPYRFSFDLGGEHALLAGDAGQELWEEVSRVTIGGNYGWNVKEGTHCFDAENAGTPPEECPDTDAEGDPLIDPVIEFANARQEGGLGQVVIGGYVYRGSALPEMDGAYFFGVWSGGRAGDGALPGRVFVAEMQAEGMWPFQEVAFGESGLSHYLLSFGQDRSGELYLLTTDEVGPVGTTGRVYRLIAPEGVARERDGELPVGLALAQNYPNPFNPSTTIAFELERPGTVSLVVYDATGREVRRLLEGTRSAGSHTVAWDGTDDGGRLLPSGTYFYRLQAGASSVVRTMVLVK